MGSKEQRKVQMLFTEPGKVYHLLDVYVESGLALRESFLYRIPVSDVKGVGLIDFLNLLNSI